MTRLAVRPAPLTALVAILLLVRPVELEELSARVREMVAAGSELGREITPQAAALLLHLLDRAEPLLCHATTTSRRPSASTWPTSGRLNSGGAGVPHRGREAGEQHMIPRVVPLQQHAVALDADGGRDVVVFGGPEEWVQQQPVDRLERRLLDVLVRPVHRIPRLKADHGAPAALDKRAPGVRGIERQLRERQGGAPE